MEPKGRRNGGQMEPKIDVREKSADSEFDLLFTMYSPHLPYQKSSFFRLLEH